MYVFTHMCARLCICIWCLCMSLCMHVYIYAYAYIQRNGGVGVSHSVVSDSLEPHGPHQAPLCMGFSGKNAGVGCHLHA